MFQQPSCLVNQAVLPHIRAGSAHTSMDVLPPVPGFMHPPASSLASQPSQPLMVRSTEQ